MDVLEYRVVLFEDRRELKPETGIDDVEAKKNAQENIIFKNIWEAEKEYSKELSEITGYPEYVFNPYPGMIVAALSDKNDVLGFITISLNLINKSCWIAHSWVNKRCRKQGVYKLMLKRVIKAIEYINKNLDPERQIERLELGIFLSNAISKKVHRKIGFLPVARLCSAEIKKISEKL